MKNSQELHRKTFELTLALYRVTDFFPQGEILKRQLRERANEVFGGVTEYGYADSREQGILALLAHVETIKGYLHIARSMRFVRPINLTILEREYEFLENLLKGELQCTKRDSRADQDKEEFGSSEDDLSRDRDRIDERSHNKHARADAHMTDRQKKILVYVKKAPRAKISDFYTLLTGVSAKTIQRDLRDLVQKDILRKNGEKRWTNYSLK